MADGAGSPLQGGTVASHIQTVPGGKDMLGNPGYETTAPWKQLWKDFFFSEGGLLTAAFANHSPLWGQRGDHTIHPLIHSLLPQFPHLLHGSWIITCWSLRINWEVFKAVDNQWVPRHCGKHLQSKQSSRGRGVSTQGTAETTDAIKKVLLHCLLNPARRDYGRSP